MSEVCKHDNGSWQYHKPDRNRKRCTCGQIVAMTPEECWRNREQWEPEEENRR